MPFEKEIAAAHETLAFFKGSPSWTPTLGVNVNACLLEHLLSLTTPASSTPPEGKVRGLLQAWVDWYAQGSGPQFKTPPYSQSIQALAAPAPACKNRDCKDGRIWYPATGHPETTKPCPDCNAGEKP